MNNQELVSGYEFYKLCKWCICPRYEINFNPNEIKENDFVFLNLDYFNSLLEKCIALKIKFRLITHNSDLSFTDYHFNSLKPYVHKVFAINSICNNKNVIKIPLGFVDDKYKPHFKFYNIVNEKHDKNILLYMNFSINTNIEKREICYHTFKNENLRRFFLCFLFARSSKKNINIYSISIYFNLLFLKTFSLLE